MSNKQIKYILEITDLVLKNQANKTEYIVHYVLKIQLLCLGSKIIKYVWTAVKD